MKFESYLHTLSNDTLIKMYEIVFKNHIDKYPDMERGQLIEEILEEIINN